MTSGLGLEGLLDFAPFLVSHEKHLALILSPQASQGSPEEQIIGVLNVALSEAYPKDPI